MSELKQSVPGIHGRCLICFEDKPFDVFRTGCGLPPNDVVGVCKDCTAAAVAARDARRGRIVKLLDDDARSRIRSMAADPLNYPAGEVSEALLSLLKETRTLSTAAGLMTVEDLANIIGHARHLSITGKPQTMGDSPMDQAVHGADVAAAQVLMAYVTMNVAPLREALEQIAKLSQETPTTPVGGLGFPNWGGQVVTLGEIARNALDGGGE